MDVLDHSCSKMGFGGKMCVDGTKKQEEELTAPLFPFKANTAFPETQIRNAYPEIKGINYTLAAKFGIPVLFVAVEEKTSPGMSHGSTMRCANCREWKD